MSDKSPRFFLVWLAVWICFGGLGNTQESVQSPIPTAGPETFPNTVPLRLDGDVASHLVDNVDAFLLKRWEVQRAVREKVWQQAIEADNYAEFLRQRRQELRKRLGLVDEPSGVSRPRFLSPIGDTDQVASGPGWQARYITWPAFGDFHAQGILVEPTTDKIRGQVIALPDADETPEDWVGFPREGQVEPGLAARLAQQGFRVVLPALIHRDLSKRNGRANLTSREFVYRPAFEMGRHLIGFEVQEILTARRWLTHLAPEMPIGLLGYGEGAHLGLYAVAIDPELKSVLLSGDFSTKSDLWNQPLDRNVFGRMLHFGDAELALMVHPRPLILEVSRGPEIDLPSEGGAPAKLVSPSLQDAMAEWDRLSAYCQRMGSDSHAQLVDAEGAVLKGDSLELFCNSLAGDEGRPKSYEGGINWNAAKLLEDSVRQQRLVQSMIDHTQRLLVESPYVRKEYMKDLNTSSLEAYEKSSDVYRRRFRNEIIGSIGSELAAIEKANLRTRRAYAGEGWSGYDVVLDLYGKKGEGEDLFAYGILLWPDGIKPDEKRPVVVCQHGLEGRPQDIIAGDHPAYHDFAAKLAQQGYIVFAPQNIYIFKDRFRTLQRKANPLQLTLFSVMVDQHQQITNWLRQLPNVDPSRIGFYGLSYGGKSAMRIPALVDNYCLSICSADFNEWVWKNASTRGNYSYVWTGEYEIFEFDLGSTFNYAEMAALIAPRPFMVERGHFDGVAPDETVAYEFAKVRNLYAARLGLSDRCEIEWFVGPHTIHGEGTFEFLSRHLKWPIRE